MSRRSKRPVASGWDGRHHHNEQSDNADQVEWQAVLYGSASVAAGTMDDEMSESADQDTFLPGHEPERLQDKEVVREVIQGSVAEILVTRQRMLDVAYPFEIEGNSLRYKPTCRLVYEVLLGITQAQSLTEGVHAQLPRLFEELSLLASQGYLGPDSGGYRTGWPRPETVAHFQQAIADVKAAAAPGDKDPEWHWNPELGLPQNPAPALVKEEGLDLVAWRKWADDRGSPLYLFGQCACGSNWMGKGNDIDFNMLNRWFRFPAVLPIRSLFVPRYVVPTLMREISQRAGLVFDRVRMVLALRAPHVELKLDALTHRMSDALDVAKRPPKAKESRGNMQAA